MAAQSARVAAAARAPGRVPHGCSWRCSRCGSRFDARRGSSLDEVAAIYLPLSRLLSLYVAATQGLFKATQRFLLAEQQEKVPYIIGVAGSVAVGKSTTARVLMALLARWPNTPKVDLVTTDGFLLPNAELTRLGLMERKGFPESYDTGKLLHFLADIKAGKRTVKAPPIR